MKREIVIVKINHPRVTNNTIHYKIPEARFTKSTRKFRGRGKMSFRRTMVQVAETVSKIYFVERSFVVDGFIEFAVLYNLNYIYEFFQETVKIY